RPTAPPRTCSACWADPGLHRNKKGPAARQGLLHYGYGTGPRVDAGLAPHGALPGRPRAGQARHLRRDTALAAGRSGLRPRRTQYRDTNVGDVAPTYSPRHGLDAAPAGEPGDGTEHASKPGITRNALK